jgi:hypothetical protein
VQVRPQGLKLRLHPAKHNHALSVLASETLSAFLLDLSVDLSAHRACWGCFCVVSVICSVNSIFACNLANQCLLWSRFGVYVTCVDMVL